MKVRRVDYYPDEYIVGVSRLSYEHQGLYWMVCSLIMSHGGPIPNDPKWLGKLGSMGAARCRRLLSELVSAGKLIENCGKIGQKRAENELKLAQKRIEIATENGQKGGRPSNKNNGLVKPDGLSAEKLTTNYQLPTTKESIDSINGHEQEHEPRKSEFEGAFEDRFWPRYPRRVGKAAAKTKFVKKAQVCGVEAIMSGLERAVKEWEAKGTDSEFIPHPTTWLNQGRWEDEPAQRAGPKRHMDAL